MRNSHCERDIMGLWCEWGCKLVSHWEWRGSEVADTHLASEDITNDVRIRVRLCIHIGDDWDAGGVDGGGCQRRLQLLDSWLQDSSRTASTASEAWSKRLQIEAAAQRLESMAYSAALGSIESNHTGHDTIQPCQTADMVLYVLETP